MHQMKRVTRLLEQERDTITDKALLISTLSDICRLFLPLGIGRHIRAANLREGTLILMTDNQSAAAKVRLLSNALCAHIAAQRPEISSVSVRVQPASSSSPKQASRVQKPSLLALSALAATHQTMRASPARDALERFLHNQGAPVARSSTSGNGNAGALSPTKKQPGTIF